MKGMRCEHGSEQVLRAVGFRGLSYRVEIGEGFHSLLLVVFAPADSDPLFRKWQTALSRLIVCLTVCPELVSSTPRPQALWP